jgi:hypothetical protein
MLIKRALKCMLIDQLYKSMCVVYRVLNSLTSLYLFSVRSRFPSSILGLAGSGSVGVWGDSLLRNSDEHNGEVFLGQLCVCISWWKQVVWECWCESSTVCEDLLWQYHHYNNSQCM